MPDFNKVAGFYDFLKRVVFGDQISKATNYFLSNISSDQEILIIGGGTGQVLLNFNPKHRITYLELSESMIEKAKSRNYSANVHFVQADVIHWQSNSKFDIIITPFILDCFNNSQLEMIFPKLKSSLNSGGEWIQTDFYPKNRSQRVLVSLMYLFFRVFTDLKIKKVEDFDSFFQKHQFSQAKKVSFYGSMIESKIYRHIE